VFLSSLRTRGGGEEGDRWSCAMGSAARRGLLSALALALAARAAGLDGGPATTRLRELKTVPLGVVAGGSASQKIAERKTFWEQYREGVRLEAFAGLDSVDDDAIEENEMGTQGGDDIERCSTAAEMLEKKGADYTCAFVTERCSGRGLGPLNYLQLPYCMMPGTPWLSGLILLVWITVLFIWLVAMVDFLIPSLAAMSAGARLRESVAGATFLAFGNGSSDLFSMSAATLSGRHGMELAIGEVLGNGMFVFCGIQGIIALLFSFKVNPVEYVRDTCFYLLSIAILLLVLLDGEVSLLEGLTFIAIYAIYVVTVVQFERILQVFGIEHGGLVADDDSSGDPKKATEFKEHYSFIHDASKPESPLHEVLTEHVFPLTVERFGNLPILEKIVAIIQWPMIAFLKVTVPVVDSTLPLSGWCRPAVAMQLLLLPPLVTAFVGMRIIDREEWNGMLFLIIAMVVSVAVGICLAAALVINSDERSPPSFHGTIAFVGFGASVLWIYISAEEIVNVILAFGIIFQLSHLLLGITILAVGIGMQDLVTNIGVARSGYPNMAAGACVGAPLLNLLMGLGLCAVLGNLFIGSPYPLRLTVQLLMCLGFLAGSVLLALVLMVWGNFTGTPLFGGVMIGCYVTFIITTVAMDTVPFGTVRL